MPDHIKTNFQDKLRPGDSVIAKIDGYTHAGWGVARHDGRVIFIKGALRGELVRAEITGERRGVLYGGIVELLSVTSQRRQPECPVYEQCGGCQLQHMSYTEELAFKAEQVRAALMRIGGLADFEQRPICAAAEIYHYRNKGVFHVSRQAGRARLSFWDEGSRQPAGEACLLLFPPVFAKALELLQSTDSGFELPERVQNVLLRYSFAEDKLLLMFDLDCKSETSSQSCRDYLRRLAARLPELAVWGVKCGGDYQVFSKEQYLMDKLGNTEYHIAPGAFFQVNNAQTQALLASVQAALGGDCRVLLDIYCGLGTLGIFLAKNLPGLEQLAGIELNPAAVETAAFNARLNSIRNAEFWQGRAEDKFARLQARYRNIDAVIIDPPRRGCDKRFLAELLKLSPSKLVYVSCNPASLARDLKILCAGEYAIDFVQPVDMFPRTHHVETVILLSQQKPDDVIRVGLDLDELEVTPAESKATYGEIKAYVWEKFGLKVSSLYISQVKRKCCLEVGENYNISKSENAKQPQCPPDKEKAIIEALRHFQMIGEPQ